MGACAAIAFTTPVCALGITYVEEIDPAAWVWHLSALTVGHRERIFEQNEERALFRLWMPADWDHNDVLSNPERLPGLAWEVAHDLLEAGCEDPEGAFACEVAYRLSRLEWKETMTVSDDFACWALEHELSEDVFDTFRLTAPADVVRTYDQRNWLRFADSY